MLAFTSDIGVLARLVMASEGRWLLVLSERMDIDITKEFKSWMDQLDTEKGMPLGRYAMIQSRSVDCSSNQFFQPLQIHFPDDR